MTPADVLIGVHAHADPARLRATIQALRAHTSAAASLILLGDGADAATRAALAALALPQLSTDEPRGAPACFNRLAAATDARIVVLLESGSLVTPGWLERLCAGLDAGAAHGLAGPSTNACWNEQAAVPASRARAASADDIARLAADVARRFGDATRPLAPLHSLADFCYAVRREVVEAIGGADEGYRLGPCWEMDYNARAARAGLTGVWVQGAYVHRLPMSDRRRIAEAQLFRANRRLYQDRLCGLRLRGERKPGRDYEPHCKGDACADFAPAALIVRHLPLPERATPIVLPPPPPAPEPPPPAARREPNVPVVVAGALPPAVSCIMPTSNRPGFVPQAIRYFLRQDFTDSELVILDDGPTSVAALVPAHPRIRYVRLEGPRLTVGAKRNRACELAAGALIAHWDDDDWYPPWRLRRQVEALERSGFDVCGSRETLFYEPAQDRAWRYQYGGVPGRFLMGTTLLYRREFWRRHPFADVQVGEDVRFVAHAASEVVDLADASLAVAIVHDGNTSPKRTGATYWLPTQPDAVHRLLGDDLGFYRAGAEAASATPRVSCIMPTRNRRAFVAHSLQLFAAQDYPNREIIVVDDGDDAVADLVEGVPGARYVRAKPRTPIGTKRNLACEAASGAIVVHWDDDDWYGASRLAFQAAPILAGLADLTGLENRFVLELPAERFWTTGAALHRRMFAGDVHGGTLAFRRAIFEGGLRYPAANLAEDASFLRGALRAGHRLTRLPNDGVFVYVRHGENAWRFQVGEFMDRRGWSHVEPPPTFTEADLAAYRAIVS